MTLFAQTGNIQFCSETSGETVGKSTLTTGVEYAPTGESITVYSYGRDVIIGTPGNNLEGTVVVYNLNGMELVRSEIQGSTNYKIDVPVTSSSVCVVKIYTNEKTISRKLYLK